MTITLTIPQILINSSVIIGCLLLLALVIFGFMSIIRHFYREKGLYGFLVMYSFFGKSAEYLTANRIMKAFQILKFESKEEELKALINEIDKLKNKD